MAKKVVVKAPKIRMQITGPGINGSMTLNLKRFESQYEKTQYELDSMVMASMIPFMPMQAGKLVDLTKAKSDSVAGSGIVYAAVPPTGRFLYEGKVMVDEKTGSTWARKGSKKVLVSQFSGKTNARENIEFSKEKHPNAQDHWFDAAKEKDLDAWIKKVKKTAGGGANVRFE